MRAFLERLLERLLAGLSCSVWGINLGRGGYFTDGGTEPLSSHDAGCLECVTRVKHDGRPRYSITRQVVRQAFLPVHRPRGCDMCLPMDPADLAQGQSDPQANRHKLDAMPCHGSALTGPPCTTLTHAKLLLPPVGLGVTSRAPAPALPAMADAYIAAIALLAPQGRNSFVRDNCHLLAGTVLPEGAVVPPFTVVSAPIKSHQVPSTATNSWVDALRH